MPYGLHKQVIQLQGEEGTFFEQVIFVLRPGTSKGQDRVLREAERIVEQYQQSSCSKSPGRGIRSAVRAIPDTSMRAWLIAAGAAAGAGVAFLLQAVF